MKGFGYFVLFTSIAVCSCKKGDEDPFFTLATRKARICGEWKMTAYTESFTNSQSGSILAKSSTEGTETEMTKSYYSSPPFTTPDYVEQYTFNEYSLTVNRDGTWSMTKEYDFRYELDNSYVHHIRNRHEKETESGTWSFVKRTDGYKNKERILLNILEVVSERGERIDSLDYKDPLILDKVEIEPAYSTTATYATGYQTVLYDLLMLKSDEMIWTLQTGATQDDQISTGLKEITWKIK